jgi:hypothetical protein
LTVKVTAALRDRAPDVPVIVTVADPKVAVPDALSVSVLLLPVVDDGLKLALTPLGSPLALNDTFPVNPPVRAIAIDVEPLAPRLMLRLDGVVESEKSC